MGVHEWIEKRYIERMIDSLNDTDRSGIHVTDLVSPCSRQIFYNLKMKDFSNGDEKRISPEQAHTLWLGKKYHEIMISNVVIKPNGEIYVVTDLDQIDVKFDGEKYIAYDKTGVEIGIFGYELPFDYYDIKGQVDEIVHYDGEIYVVDKKSTKRIPYKPYDTHVRQVEIYSVLLWRQYNVRPVKGAVLYIQKIHEPNKGDNKFKVKAYTWNLRPLEEIEKEMLERLAFIKNALENDELPEAVLTKLCQWCQWKTMCKDNQTEIRLEKQKTLEEFWW